MQSIVNQYVASKLATDLLNNHPEIPTQWCKEHGVNILPSSDRSFQFMLISRLTCYADELISKGEVVIGGAKYSVSNSVIRNNSAGNHLVATTDDLSQAEMVIETKGFVNGVAGVEYTHEEDKLSLLNEILNSPERFDKNWRENNLLLGEPKMQYDLNDVATGWYYLELANGLLDNISTSYSGYLFNAKHAFKVRSENKNGFTASLVGQATAIDLMTCK